MPPKKAEKKADGEGPSPEEELKELAMKNTTLELQLRKCSPGCFSSTIYSFPKLHALYRMLM
jgi:hypothetical protein